MKQTNLFLILMCCTVLAFGKDIPTGTYILKSALEGRNMDVAGNQNANGAGLVLWDGHGGDNQQFTIEPSNEAGYYFIKTKWGRALDIAWANPNSGASLITYDVHGGDNQKWQFFDTGDGYCNIRSKYGTYIDVQWANPANGATIWMSGYSTWSNNVAQKWKLERLVTVPTGTYVLKSGLEGRNMDVAANINANGAGLVLWDGHAGDNQQFTVEPSNEAGYYSIKTKWGRVLDIAWANPNSGASLITYDAHGGDNQKWQFIDKGDGFLNIRSKYGTYIDVQWANPANGATIWMSGYSTWSNNVAQKWKLERVEPIATGTYWIQSALGAKNMDVAGNNHANGANLILWDVHGGENQQFTIEPSNEAGYYFIKTNWGRVLDIAWANPNSGASLTTYDAHGGDNQKWQFIDKGDGYFNIRSKYGTFIDVQWANPANGATLWMSGYSNWGNNIAQKWRLVRTFPLQDNQLKQVAAATTDKADANQVKLFPNPTSGNVSVETDDFEPIKYTVFNSLGQMVQEAVLNGKAFQLSDLPNGNYQVVLSDGTKQVQKRIVKY
jgi:Ricin-type beta-trefoil lectin domain-like/Secretion system C-terminal sorting domain